jgi:hypothetical protein
MVTRDDKYSDVIPKISEEAYQALKASIAEHGEMLSAIVLDSEGVIVDGHSRHRAYLELGTEGINVELKTRVLDFADEAAARSYIRAVNIARRQLSTKDKRNLIDAELRDNPSDSNRAIAIRLGVDHETVGARREKLEATGGIRQLTETKGRDGRRRKRTRQTRRQAAEPKPADDEPAQDAEAGNSDQDPEITEPDSDAAAVEPEPIEGNGVDPTEAVAELAEPVSDEAMFDATREFLVAVRRYTLTRGRSASIHDIANAAHDWINASLEQVDWSPHRFTAWLDEGEAAEIEADRFEAAADRLN